MPDVDPPTDPGGLLRYHRGNAGMGQQQLAARAGVSVRALRDIEQGRVRRPRGTSVRQLVAALPLADRDRAALLHALSGDSRQPPPPSAGIDIEVLGPLVVRRGDARLEPDQAMSRTLLSLLALQAGEAVSSAEAIDVLWGDDPPRTCRNLIQVYIGRLRRVLDRGRGVRAAAPSIRLSTAGYILDPASVHIDVAHFSELYEQAVRARAVGDADAARVRYLDALRCWRGPVLGDADQRLRHHPTTVRLTRRRVEAALAHADLALGAGRSAEALAHLRELATTEPLHEGVHARLIRALVANGEQAAALRTFQNLRDRLVDQLGVTPGAELAAAHLEVLRGPALSGGGTHVPAPAPVRQPAQPVGPGRLPAGVAAPTGRMWALEQVDRARGATSRPWQVPPAPPTFIGRDRDVADLVGAATAGSRALAIHGLAGTGKTALALTVARALANRYPDGNLFHNLGAVVQAGRVAVHGPAVMPGSPSAPLPLGAAPSPASWLLRGLGLPAADVPLDPVQCATTLRSAVAGRRMILVLDDAAAAADIVDLIPVTSSCLTIVTSRRMLSELDAYHLGLHPLDPDAAQALLCELVGTDRMRADSTAARAIADYCGRLPLALRIISARLSRRPGYPLRRLADRLADERRRLDELELDGAGVRPSLRLSYEALSNSADPVNRLAAEAFRLRGLVALPVNPMSLAAGLERATNDVDAALDRLIEMRLLETDEADLLQMHDLLRIFAAEQAAATADPAARDSEVRRVYRHYLHMTHGGVATVRPRNAPPAGAPGTPEPSATEQLERELPTLLAIARHGAREPDRFGDVTVDLLLPLASYLPPRGHWELLQQFGELAGQAATHRGDLVGQARALTALAMVDRQSGRVERAKQRLTEAMAIRTACGDRRAEASTLDNIGLLHQWAGEVIAAFACYARAMRLHREFDRPAHLATTMHNLAGVYEQLGRVEAAERFLRRSFSLRRSTGDRFGEACTLVALGRVSALCGHMQFARTALADGIALARQVGYREAEWDGLICRGEIARRAGDATGAAADFEQAQSVAVAHRDRHALRLTAERRGLLVHATSGPVVEVQPPVPQGLYWAPRPEIELFLQRTWTISG